MIKKSETNSNIDAIWITMISGRSLNQYDPDPDNKEFYYYHNQENGFNIKVVKPEKFIEGFDTIPKITEGNIGDFYKDKNEDIYVKVDEHKIDHIDSVPMDARTHKLREIPCTTNAINRIRKDNSYTGVTKTKSKINPYKGTIMYRWTSMQKSFKTEVEAARFYDYHALALHGILITNNNTLTKDEINDLLLYGIEKIPKEYRIIKKIGNEFPGLTQTSENTYELRRKFKTLKVSKTYKTFNEAYEAWLEFEHKLKEFKENEKQKTLELNKNNFGDKYGYLIIKKDAEEIRVKLNIETYKEFVHCNWWILDGKPHGTYKGKGRDLHLHVMKFYNKDYNKRDLGTVDHRYQNFFDCTIEVLRAASQSLQVQNTKRKNKLFYTGISARGNSFSVSYKGKGSHGYTYLEDAARAYNTFVIKDLGTDEFGNPNGLVNDVPNEKKTTIADLYSNDKLTYDILLNITSYEIRSIIAVNPELRKILEISNIGSINTKNFKEFRDKIVDILKLNN